MSGAEAGTPDIPQTASLKKFPVGEIPPGSYFTRTVYLDSRFVVAAPETPFTGDLARLLADWGFDTVYSAGRPQQEYAGGEPVPGSLVLDPLPPEDALPDADRVRWAREFYRDYERFMEIVFKRAVSRNDLDINEVVGRARNLCEVVRKEWRILMRVNVQPLVKDQYLAIHAVKTAVLAVIIGNCLRLPPYRVIDLAAAALLHEVGMVMLPSQIYTIARPLLPQERRLLVSHPLLGANLLTSSGFPQTVCVAVMEHHERENGSGYPRGLSGGQISLYGKVLAVACSYNALSSVRPFREAKDGHTGMVELLRNEGRAYDDTVVRALVNSLSIYPVGLYVLLSTGRKGQVVDVNPASLQFPLVQVFGEFTVDGRYRVVETSPDDVFITRPLTPEEIGAA